jgi:hypothetical protein
MRAQIRTAVAPVACLVVLAACGAGPATKPQDESAVAHREVAALHERDARLHSAEYDWQATRKTCDWEPDTAFVSCWSRNPTDSQRQEAIAHRRAAAQHRAASQSLRDAEDLTCTGIDEEDRDTSPFAHEEDIARVEPLQSEHAGVMRFDGALVEFRAVSGLTPSILQRIVDCHLARNAAMGNVVPEMPYCPLVPKGVTAKVRWKDARSNGLVVEIRASDEAAGLEVWKRASALDAR